MRERQPSQPQAPQPPPRPVEEGPSLPAASTRSGVGSESVLKALREWEQRKAADRAKRGKDRPT